MEANEIRLDNVRLAFPKLTTPEPFPGGKDPTKYYSATLILPKNHPQLKALEKLMLDLAIGKWGPKKGPSVLTGAKAIGKVFLRDGDAKADQDGFEGNMFVSARSREDNPPQLRDGMRNIIDNKNGLIYGGCYVNAIISCYAYTKGNNVIGAGLKAIQFRSKGNAFVGGPPPEDDDFDEIAAPAEEGEADPLTE